MERTALFPGTFNPFSKGHESIVRRSLLLFDKIVIGVGINPNKQGEHNADEITANIKKLYANEPRVEVMQYKGLTSDFVAEIGACCIVRGIRNKKDLGYEATLAETNFTLFNVETVFLLADPELKEISSSLIRELESFGKDVSMYLP